MADTTDITPAFRIVVPTNGTTRDWPDSAPNCLEEVQQSEPSLPYCCLHEKSVPFNELTRQCFIPGCKVTVSINSFEREASSTVLNPNLYQIEISHGGFQWIIKRRYHHFRQLHELLILYKASMKIPVPSKRHREKQRTFRLSRRGGGNILPRFPKTLDALITENNIEKRMSQLEDYLQTLLNKHLFRAHRHTLEFLDVSHLSFIGDLGEKGKEGMVKKRAGGHKIPLGCMKVCCHGNGCKRLGHWDKRWLVAKDSFLAYVKPRTGQICGVMLMDQEFSTDSGLRQTGVHHGLVITSLARQLYLRCWTSREAKEWKQSIDRMVAQSEYTRENRFRSFAPTRANTQAQWFVDGANYFEAIAEAIERAKDEIFITDWWLSPEIYMKRPAMEGNRWRLDQLLKKKAEEGVKIFVILYKEIEMALGIKSSYSKKSLMHLHENILVLRYPDHMPGGVLFWAHHEKLVVVDQNTSFLGGLDLCYGRWDDFFHRLVDVGSAIPAKHKNTSGLIRKSSELDQIDGEAKEENGNVLDVPQARVQRRTSVGENLEKLGDGLEGSAKLWLGKDYTNFIAKDFVDLHRPLQDFIDRSQMPRMPWHDIGVVVYGQAARDVARHFIQRWNYTKMNKVKESAVYPYLVPKSTQGRRHVPPESVRNTSVRCDCQVLRSVSNWSAGIEQTECSIYNAYLAAIKLAKHYIYIENQFFISCHNNPDVCNKIADALFDRIMLAYKSGEVFRVYVLLPLLPAFEGQIGESGATCILAITHWNYQSISRGGHSLLERLAQAGVENVEDYICFNGLRTHDELNGKLVTELVYVHSKLMIVDDNKVIIGSANINDRSMLGKRDSEMAVLIEDTELRRGTMNGSDYQAGVFASELRKTLFREHLGVLQNPNQHINVDDPVSESFYKMWNRTALDNTEIYQKVFRCIPCDEADSFSKLQAYRREPSLLDQDPRAADQQVARVRGYLVALPLDFLCQEDLTPSLGTQEAMLPAKIWT